MKRRKKQKVMEIVSRQCNICRKRYFVEADNNIRTYTCDMCKYVSHKRPRIFTICAINNEVRIGDTLIASFRRARKKIIISWPASIDLKKENIAPSDIEDVIGRAYPGCAIMFYEEKDLV